MISSLNAAIIPILLTAADFGAVYDDTLYVALPVARSILAQYEEAS